MKILKDTVTRWNTARKTWLRWLRTPGLEKWRCKWLMVGFRGAPGPGSGNENMIIGAIPFTQEVLRAEQCHNRQFNTVWGEDLVLRNVTQIFLQKNQPSATWKLLKITATGTILDQETPLYKGGNNSCNHLVLWRSNKRKDVCVCRKLHRNDLFFVRDDTQGIPLVREQSRLCGVQGPFGP